VHRCDRARASVGEKWAPPPRERSREDASPAASSVSSLPPSQSSVRCDASEARQRASGGTAESSIIVESTSPRCGAQEAIAARKRAGVLAKREVQYARARLVQLHIIDADKGRGHRVF
jgi:hypothetical protein